MNRFKISLEKKTSRSYEVYVGREILDRAVLLIAKGNWAQRYFLLTDDNVASLHGERVADTFRQAKLPVETIVIPAGEQAKTMATAVAAAEEMLRRGADRTAGLIALGGGVVGDITGFVASIFMRGIPYVQLPTTLLAQVDSSIGGKTGVDLPAAKNMLGTFHQPKAVFAELSFLRTLPDREMSNGLAEIVKCAVIDDPGLLELLESQAEALRDTGATDVLMPVVTRAGEIKKKIVEIDEKEQGLRRILNFGHTIGHAVEAAAAYAIPHGEAVSIGMTGALLLSERLGHLPAAEGERIVALLNRMGLPVAIPAGLDGEAVMAKMEQDKKKAGGMVHFVLLKRPGMPFVNGGIPGERIREIIASLQTEHKEPRPRRDR
ncbi:MAG TPA: 3-dehydroquinate synthase [Syntrophales bacterium]|nr:3-dehydroquinate synthase [Syntrophales bacterium]HPC31984.1 3-dehydroquinate synthase [Syntrophales bacterium]HQG34640.1 3-dehydroquinate synthase [Syntrophales bacterium]HQI36604.1 3-dehydroquinate synthase [Syntrophales bacterium]HQJ30821.1 3-dehydroquinate synthase [Syntrophales bacterium]